MVETSDALEPMESEASSKSTISSSAPKDEEGKTAASASSSASAGASSSANTSASSSASASVTSVPSTSQTSLRTGAPSVSGKEEGGKTDDRLEWASQQSTETGSLDGSSRDPLDSSITSTTSTLVPGMLEEADEEEEEEEEGERERREGEGERERQNDREEKIQ